MKLENYLIALLIIGGCFAAIYTFAAQLGLEYGVEVSGEYRDSYDKITELQNISQTMSDELQNVTQREESAGFFSGVWDFFQMSRIVVFGTGQSALKSVEVGTTLAGQTVSDAGVGGGWATGLLIALVTFSLVFAIIYLAKGQT